MKKNILALITARGGSKSIPHKNIVPLAGRPLLAYTCAAAQGSRHISRTVLSTDDPEIAEVGRACGVEVPFMRPAEIAQDKTPSIDVALHAVEWLAENEGWQTDILLLLQPTSPLRTATHIDEALDAMLQADADTVVSVIPVPHSCSPYSIMRLENGRLSDFWTEPTPFNRYRRQEVPTFYARNGPAVLATKTPILFAKRGFYGDHIVPYLMNEHDSTDIDEPFDLEYTEFLLNRKRE